MTAPLANPLGFVGLVAGLLLSLWLGHVVKWVMDQATAGIDLSPPAGIEETAWEQVTIVPSENAGLWLGRLERLLFFAAIWFGVVTMILGWLAFQVATKWEL